MKKFLSIALALAMTLSLVVVGASATEYEKLTDKASIKHTEAVTVMNKLGIISGYSDGSFKPTASITRGAAAKIICMTKLGVSTANTLSSMSAPFKDVSTSNVFAPYIAYCNNMKVVNGYTDNTFRPSDAVTGYAFAKMLLTALDITGAYTGSGWEINVAAAAQKNGLFDGIASTVIMSKALTRDDACQMALNALNYSATSTNTYSVTVYTAAQALTVDTNIATNLTNTTYYKATPYNTFSTANEAMSFFAVMNSQAAGYGIEAKTGKVITVVYDGKTTTASDSLLKTVFSVTRKTAAADKYGRPSTTYTAAASAWKLTFNGTPVKTYTSAVTNGKIYSDLDAYTTAIPVTVNAAKNAAATTITPAAGGTTTVGGNGITTEIYNVGTTAEPEYKAVEVAPLFAAVTIASTPATSTHGAYTSYAIGGNTEKIFSTVVDQTADVNTAVVTGTVANGDMVEYYYDHATTPVLHIQAVTTLNGTLTAKTSGGVYTIDSKSYEMAAAATTTPTVSTSKQTFYMDANGYILGTKTAASVDNYAAVLSSETTYAYNTTTGYMTPTYLISVINAEGKVAKLPVTKTDYDTYNTATTGIVAKNSLVTYVPVTDTKGVTTYTLNAVVADSSFASKVTAIVNKTNAMTTTQIATTGTEGTAKYADANTLFVVANYDSTGAVTGTVTTYTGIANVPSYSSLNKTYAVDTATTSDGVANVVFMMDNKSATASDSYVYLTGSYTQNASGYALNAIVNGKAATYTVSALYANSYVKADTADMFTQCASTATFDASAVYYLADSTNLVKTSYTAATFAAVADKTTLYTMNLKGLYKTFTVSSGAVTTVLKAGAEASTTGIKVSSGLFYTTTDNSTWAVYTHASIADATPVYTIHTVSGTCTASTASTVGSLMNAAGVYVNWNGTSIVSVFVTYAD